MGQILGMGLTMGETLNFCYSKASLKSIDTKLIHENFLLYVSGQCSVL